MADQVFVRQEQAEAAIKQLAVSLHCPACGAQPGNRCRKSPKATLPSGHYHKARIYPLIQAYTVGLAAAAIGEEKP
jgi:hypothetical protein